jgi:5-methylcytosine-specific restriction endonuclease McrA
MRKFPRSKLSRQARGYNAEYDRNRRLMIADAWEKQLPCVRCGMGFQKVSDITADHLIPKALGLDNSLANLAPAHRACNQSHGARLGNTIRRRR